MSASVSALQQQGTQDLSSFMPNFGKLVGYDNVPAHLDFQRIIDLIPKLGFYMKLTETFTTTIDDFIFNPLSDWSDRKGFVSASTSASLSSLAA